MVRKFLYAVALLLVGLIAGAFALRIWGTELAEAALVPGAAFTPAPALAENAYGDTGLWLSHPRLNQSDPARWQPDGVSAGDRPVPPFAVFFVHPTSYLERAQWNAPLDDAESRSRARTFLRGLASAFGSASEIWAPRYRQATFGAFLTEKPEAARAIDLAYRDVAQAFEQFATQADPALPIVLAGHSQGALHVLRLLHERIAGTPLQARVAMVYAVGWPISLEHDLPELRMPACRRPEQSGCIVSWASFAEPADPGEWFEPYRESPGLDGRPRGEDAILCVNPLTGTQNGRAPAEANLGTLKPNAQLSDGELVVGAVPARCDARGLLLIGDPPELGPYVLPGNNYHVYDIPLFWLNVRRDVERRVGAWTAAR